MLKIAVAGATGWVGRALCLAIADADELELVAATSRSQAGKSLGEALDWPGLDLIVTGNVREALAAQPEVLVDYTSAVAVKDNVLAAINAGVHVVVGSSGLSEADFAEIDALARAKDVGVIAAGNFAVTAVLLQRFAVMAARYLSQWEIIDFASDSKIDAPSGTTRELAHRLAQVRPPAPTLAISETVGEIDSRGTDLEGTQIHSIRVPGYTLSAEVIFGAPDERLTIRHDAGSGPEPYIGGTLLAIRRVTELVGLIRGLDQVMD
ncbi:MAG: 4-hydroxy-tetrahydrodipicolinate reductase [Pyrinomonadaceae bacterium]